LLVYDHPRENAAICTDLIRINPTALAFLTSFDFALLFWRDVVVPAVD
jgi:hypothetical protein